MRLRLVVRRHSLPDTAIVWAIEPGDNPTISQLLEYVNEVVPLESDGDWGLEDYSVEIKGASTNYECLHFQLIKAILHEDDEILIRPLLSQDLKLRKVAGRHQITSDGKHLFDGSVFGRPRPRSIVDRPAIEIPPRKRRRITYDEEADASFDDSTSRGSRMQVTDDPGSSQQLVIRSELSNFDYYDDDEDEEDDEDFVPEEQEEEPEDTHDEAEDFPDEEVSGKDILYGRTERSDQDGCVSSSTDSSGESSEDSEGSEGSRDGESSHESSSAEDSSGSDASSTSISDSDSDSESEPDEVSSRPPVALSAQKCVPDAVAAANTLSKDLGSTQNAPIPPGQGKTSTRKRNERRRKANMFNRFKKKGILPAGMTIAELSGEAPDELQAAEGASQALPSLKAQTQHTHKGNSARAASQDATFEARRQELLNSLASGGVELGEPPEASAAYALKPSGYIGASSGELLPPDAENIPQDEAITEEHDLSKQGDASIQSRTDKSIPRSRMKVDLGAAGRLLFGALGVRAPKSKADHDRVRHELTKDIRVPKVLAAAETGSDEGQPEGLDENSDAWREALVLRAVECCHEGIELSPAPFPFIQRWDPQQQGLRSKNGRRGGKGKKTQRNQSQYYHEQNQDSKKRKRSEAGYNSDEDYALANAGEHDDDFYPNQDGFDDVNDAEGPTTHSESIEYGVSDQLMKDVQDAATSQIADEDDLPQLPGDISTLSELTFENVTTGMVIAFKQLILSEATNWQPEISAYRTAVVIVVSEDGDLQLTLAKRDRDQGEKHYDEETGKRIYGKFSMPVYDDDQDDVDDDGSLSVSFQELIEPKIVQLAPDSIRSPMLSAEEPHVMVGLDGDESITVGHEGSTKVPGAALDGAADDPDDEPENPLENDLIEDDGFYAEEHLPANNSEAITSLPISDDTRQEISDIIKEAGFRSNVPSSVTRAQPVLSFMSAKDRSRASSYSPQFHGFDSSPPMEANPSPACLEAAAAPLEELPALESPAVDTTPSAHYPKLSFQSSPGSQVSDRGHQPDYSAPGDSTLEAFDAENSFLGVREDSLGSAHLEFPSSQPINVIDRSIEQVGIENLVEPNTPSDDDLPSLAEFFSTDRTPVLFRQSKGPYPVGVFKSEEEQASDSYNRAMEALDAQVSSSDEDPDQVTPKASQMNQPVKSPKTSDSKKWFKSPKASRNTKPSGSKREGKSQFMIPPGSQQIDLTLSSDVEPGVEDGLPTGPGWVDKRTRNKRRQSSAVPSGAASSHGSQGRTRRRRTMARF